MADDADLAQELSPPPVRARTRSVEILVRLDLTEGGAAPTSDVVDGIRESLEAEVKAGIYAREGVAGITSYSVRPAGAFA